MAFYNSSNWFGRNIVQPVAATGIRAGAVAAQVAGADNAAQGLYRQASNITNQNAGIMDGLALSTSGTGLPYIVGGNSGGGGGSGGGSLCLHTLHSIKIKRRVLSQSLLAVLVTVLS